MKRQVEIEDSLRERTESAIDEVGEALRQYLEDNPDTEDCPCLHNDLDYSGAIHEIIDSAVPLYTHEIKCTWFLHDAELEKAYEHSGIGDNPRENNGMVAIYCYIEQQVYRWYHANAQEIFEDWRESHDATRISGIAHAKNREK